MFVDYILSMMISLISPGCAHTDSVYMCVSEKYEHLCLYCVSKKKKLEILLVNFFGFFC